MAYHFVIDRYLSPCRAERKRENVTSSHPKTEFSHNRTTSLQKSFSESLRSPAKQKYCMTSPNSSEYFWKVKSHLPTTHRCPGISHKVSRGGTHEMLSKNPVCSSTHRRLEHGRRIHYRYNSVRERTEYSRDHQIGNRSRTWQTLHKQSAETFHRENPTILFQALAKSNILLVLLRTLSAPVRHFRSVCNLPEYIFKDYTYVSRRI